MPKAGEVELLSGMSCGCLGSRLLAAAAAACLHVSYFRDCSRNPFTDEYCRRPRAISQQQQQCLITWNVVCSFAHVSKADVSAVYIYAHPKIHFPETSPVCVRVHYVYYNIYYTIYTCVQLSHTETSRRRIASCIN